MAKLSKIAQKAIVDSYDYRGELFIVYKSPLSETLQIDGGHSPSTDFTETLEILVATGGTNFNVLYVDPRGCPHFEKITVR